MTDGVSFEPAQAEDFETLLALRIGRFDPQRARERFLSGFEVQHTRHVLFKGQRVGLVVLKPLPDGWLLDHLYIHPDFQNRGVGSAVLGDVLERADAHAQVVHVSALKQSDSNRFYQRHGFELHRETEWDLHYVRQPKRPSQ